MFSPEKSFQFGGYHIVMRGDPVVVLKIYGLELMRDAVLRAVLERPEQLDAYFDGVRALRDPAARRTLG